LLLF
jgi:ribosomal protein L11 methylase PrmA